MKKFWTTFLFTYVIGWGLILGWMMISNLKEIDARAGQNIQREADLKSISRKE